jgi:hypothetical protein
MTTAGRTITGNTYFLILIIRLNLGNIVKDAWKNLRTYFNSCKKAQQSATGLAEDDAPKKWKFFDQIAMFMITVPRFDGEVSYVILADGGFGLSDYVLNPFPTPTTNTPERANFNTHLSRFV